MKLGFGLMRLPVLNGKETDIDLERFTRMADTFIAAGGTYFDTVYPYHGGFSEVAFREAVVKRYPRASFTVTDKMPMFKITCHEDLQTVFDEQLERTGAGYFDYYWLHALSKDRFELAQKVGAFEFLQEKKAEGLIRHVGFSFHDTAEVLDEILTAHPEVEYVQIQANYIDWETENVQSRRCYEVLVKHGKPAIIMEPIKGGSLASVVPEAEKLMKDAEPDMSPASWAVRWIADKENVFMVLSGMSTLEQVEDNVSYMKDFEHMTDEEREIVDRCAGIIRNAIAVPCTGCRYCVSEQSCPMDIAIPDYFKFYNDVKNFTKSGWGVRGEFEKIAAEGGRPSDCVECGGCEDHCPQHLPIREYLKAVAKQFEK